MTTIDNLISKFEQDSVARLQAEQNRLLQVAEEQKKIFQDKAAQDLGPLWDLLSPGEISHSYSNDNRELSFEIPIHWLTAKGRIYQSYTVAKNSWGNMYLDFGHRTDGEFSFTLNEPLPASEEDLGKLFLYLRRALDYANRESQLRHQRDLENFFDFSGYREEGVADKLKRGLKEYPAHRETIKAAAAARRAELAKEQEARLIEQLAYELEKSEREQLGLLAEFAWRGPFEVYKVTYGAKMVSDEDGESVYTADFYTLMTEDEAYMPHNRGYWTAFEKGEYTRRIKPAHMISIEKVKISGNGQAPNDLRRWITLESKVVKDVSIGTFIPPIELFAFDYDALKVAVEAEWNTDGEWVLESDPEEIQKIKDLLHTASESPLMGIVKDSVISEITKEDTETPDASQEDNS